MFLFCYFHPYRSIFVLFWCLIYLFSIFEQKQSSCTISHCDYVLTKRHVTYYDDEQFKKNEKITTESDDSLPSTPSLSLQLYRINQDKSKPQNIYKLQLRMLCLSLGANNDDPGKKSRIELKPN